MENLVKCPSCAGSISLEALTCPHCGHPLKVKPAGRPVPRTYADVPWYRTNFHFTMLWIFFMPVAIIILLSGPIYYQIKGNVYRVGMGRHFLWAAGSFVVLTALWWAFSASPPEQDMGDVDGWQELQMENQDRGEEVREKMRAAQEKMLRDIKLIQEETEKYGGEEALRRAKERDAEQER